MTSFSSLGLAKPLLRAVESLGFTNPTPIQARCIPLIASGRDLVGEAQTGSGKTAAFALPILQQLAKPSAVAIPRVLVVVPTRELALQVAAVFKALGAFQPVAPRVLAVIGGEAIESQISALGKGVDILVATPGRILHLIESGSADLAAVGTLVLDEADKLLDLGFAEELESLLQTLSAERQTLLFSATMPERVLTLCSRIQRDPVTVRVDEAQVGVEGIGQRVFEVNRDRRRLLLQHLIKSESWGQTLVFVATRRATENLAAKLRLGGITAMALHGGLEQDERSKVLKRFKRGSASTLVATDLAARGIDIPKLFAVVNFDLPRSPRDYVHRIGRTGRAGETGIAVSFIDHESRPHFALIESRCGLQVTSEQLPGFELTGEPPVRTKGPGPVKGKRKSKKDKLREAARQDLTANPGRPDGS